MEIDKFDEIVNRWSESLNSQIDELQKDGKNIYLVALSRKMPRFIHWLGGSGLAMERHIRSLFTAPQNSGVTLVTEYALPIIFQGKSSDELANTAAIIVDDALIYGETANKVCTEWVGLSGRRPEFSALARLSGKSLYSVYESKESEKIPSFSLDELTDLLESISSRLTSTSLPIDMEFPLVYVPLPFEELKNHILENKPENWISYAVMSGSDGNLHESFSILLEDEKSYTFNNDFAKARVFPYGNGCVIESCAPNALNLANLDDEGLFHNTQYKELWNAVRSRVMEVDTVKEFDNAFSALDRDFFDYFVFFRKIYTLVLWANYLLSLSTFVRHKDMLVPQGVEAKVEEYDLRLLVDTRLADEFSMKVNYIISSGIISDSTRERVALPIYISPDDLEDQYERIVVESVTSDKSIEENLDAIFRISHFSNTALIDKSRIKSYGHHTIGETYESLMRRLFTYFHDEPSCEKRIHEWVDRRIDECRIAPKYELVYGSDGKPYFRRFFLAGSNTIR